MPMENNLQLDNLMKEGTFPVESVGGDRWRILHGDTLQIVQAFQPGIFDALITDPPYASSGTKQNLTAFMVNVPVITATRLKSHISDSFPFCGKHIQVALPNEILRKCFILFSHRKNADIFRFHKAPPYRFTKYRSHTLPPSFPSAL